MGCEMRPIKLIKTEEQTYGNGSLRSLDLVYSNGREGNAKRAFMRGWDDVSSI